MSDKPKFDAGIARTVANELVTLLQPFAELCVVAGSLRRQKERVGDVEILYVPRLGQRIRPGEMFESETDLVADLLQGMIQDGRLRKRTFERRENETESRTSNFEHRTPSGGAPNLEHQNTLKGGHQTERTVWGAQIKLAVHVATGVPVDFFATTRESWWNYLVCRTGPAESNEAIAKAARARGWKWEPYTSGFVALDEKGEPNGKRMVVGCEREVFEFVGMRYVEPNER